MQIRMLPFVPILYFVVCVAHGSLFAQQYDPLRVTVAERSGEDLSVQDDLRDRKIPIRVYAPETKEAAPVILFSHGLGGSRKGSSYLGKHWSARGYVVVFMQHHGSDESVWKDVPVRTRLDAMKKAMSLRNTVNRFNDVSAVLNQLEKWNKDATHPLSSRLDLTRVGMSGHSYGAVTTQAVSGQAYGRLAARFTDGRIKAAIAFSPSSPRRGDPAQAFGDVQIPWMLMTGTKDTSPVNDTTVESRTAVYPNLPEKIVKYELVLHNAEHSAFSDRALPGDRERRNPNHHRVILALSTAFWDTHLRGDAGASDWLHGNRARGVMQADDRWQFNLPSRTKANK